MIIIIIAAIAIALVIILVVARRCCCNPDSRRAKDFAGIELQYDEGVRAGNQLGSPTGASFGTGSTQGSAVLGKHHSHIAAAFEEVEDEPQHRSSAQHRASIV